MYGSCVAYMFANIMYFVVQHKIFAKKITLGGAINPYYKSLYSGRSWRNSYDLVS